jgi:poly(A) polymerase
MGTGDGAEWAAALDAFAAAADALGGDAWVVGGALRNILLGREVGDIDLAVTCAPPALVAALRGAQGLTVAHLSRDSVRLGVSAGDGALPLQLDVSPLHGPDVAADLARRDFTCNALALPLSARAELFVAAAMSDGDLSSRRLALPSLVDPLGGLRDVEHQVLRAASGHALADEPGRIVRAARMIAAFGFAPDAKLLALARAAAPLLARLAPERVREEMNALLALAACAEGLCFLADVGAVHAVRFALGDDAAARHATASVAVTRWLQDDAGETDTSPFGRLASLPPLPAFYAAALPEGIPRVVALRWGLLLDAAQGCDDVAAGRERALRETSPVSHAHVRLSKRVRATVDAVAESPHWRALLADRDPSMAELRMAADRWRDGFVDLLTGAAACDAALRGDTPASETRPLVPVATRVRVILERFFADREAFIPPPLLDGADVIRELGVAPGPEVGRAVRAARAAQLGGRVATRDEALALARHSVNVP